MGLFKRILGICETRPPADAGCWSFADGKIEITLARAAELAQPGGAIRLEGRSLPRRVLVFHGDDGRYHALPNRCTHVGHRRLDVLPGQGKIRCCSIGQSEFDYAGGRLAGSAKTSIVPLAVEVDGERLIVALAPREGDGPIFAANTPVGEATSSAPRKSGQSPTDAGNRGRDS